MLAGGLAIGGTAQASAGHATHPALAAQASGSSTTATDPAGTTATDPAGTTATDPAGTTATDPAGTTATDLAGTDTRGYPRIWPCLIKPAITGIPFYFQGNYRCKNLWIVRGVLPYPDSYAGYYLDRWGEWNICKRGFLSRPGILCSGLKKGTKVMVLPKHHYSNSGKILVGM
jgi:hypothetical protein